MLVRISIKVSIFLTTSLTSISARNATPYSALSAWALRDKLISSEANDCLTMSVHNLQWNSAEALCPCSFKALTSIYCLMNKAQDSPLLLKQADGLCKQGQY